MKIQIDGTGTKNKGAELMLYAILKEVEKEIPNATVQFNSNSKVPEYLDSKLPIVQRNVLKYAKFSKAILTRLNHYSPFFTPQYPLMGIDILLDGGGFQFSDQWDYSSKYLDNLELYYKTLHKAGTKIVFLPQAFGPFNSSNGKRSMDIVNKYADIIIAREQISHEYLLNAGVNGSKVWVYPDFTLTVSGIFPSQLKFLTGKICIIPNRKMISQRKSTLENYSKFMGIIVRECQSNGEEVFLLNHEGPDDFKLCQKINSKLDNQLEILNGLNAREVKGVIGASSMVISSRFHGVASALNQGVPCLATSWNHKYEMIFKDFGLTDMVMDVNFTEEEIKSKINKCLEERATIKNTLNLKKEELLNLTSQMWTRIWERII